MSIQMRSLIWPVVSRHIIKSTIPIRQLATAAAETKPTRKEGDISSVFLSLSGVKPAPLDERFATIKKKLIQGHEEQVVASWKRLLTDLKKETDVIAKYGPAIIPQVLFEDLDTLPADTAAEIRKRGVAVIKNVVPQEEARGYKSMVEDYVKLNPWTKGSSNCNHCPITC